MPTWGKNLDTGEEAIALTKAEAEQLRAGQNVIKRTTDANGDWELLVNLKRSDTPRRNFNVSIAITNKDNIENYFDACLSIRLDYDEVPGNIESFLKILTQVAVDKARGLFTNPTIHVYDNNA